MPDHPGRIIPVTYILIRRNHTAQTYVKVITLMFLTKLGLIGIILMCQHNTVMVFVVHLLFKVCVSIINHLR